MKTAIHCFISGRVQGVCFRMATREQAIIQEITGWARNLGDGRVEVFACGEPRQLDDLRRWLAKGPDMARVLNVECVPADYQEFDQFMIR